MRYHILATDYDGTIAHHGGVDESTLAALDRFRKSGRRLIMVTGRELPELKTVFPHLEMFDWVVAENGAQLYRPTTQETILLGEPPPDKFIYELKRRGVERISVGGCIVATWEPYEAIVLGTIRDLGLELKVIFNKGAVMILPAHLNKATGLSAALKRAGFSPHEVVGVGDAENDHAFFSICECSAAVANALPAVKERADIVLERDHGAGVSDLIDRILADDLSDMNDRITRRLPIIGYAAGGVEVRLNDTDGQGVLIAGPSGSGKSTCATTILERLGDHGYQHCVIDPEGDFATLEGAIVLGSANQPPIVDEVLQILKNPKSNVVINLVGVPLTDRPAFFVTLLGRLLEFRSQTARPHWLLIDEAHHLLPKAWAFTSQLRPQELQRTILITVHPGEVSRDVLKLMTSVIAVGPRPHDVLSEFCAGAEAECPSLNRTSAQEGEVLLWSRLRNTHTVFKPERCRSERRRHIRKYMEGELPLENQFYFRGREGKLKLRAQNLMIFLQMAEGVDDDTWTFHLERHDVSQWFAQVIKDHELGRIARETEEAGLGAHESREQIKTAVLQRYTLPATTPANPAAAATPAGTVTS
jgi:HAD superfamily hydrolase (TIGR01484 family)